MLFVTLVPHAQIERDTGNEPTFRDTEEEADGEESGEILGDAHEGAYDTPDQGESG